MCIEQEDFMEEPPKKFHRLAPGQEVRLKGAYVILCEEVIKDSEGNISELRCTYDPQTKSGEDTSGKKVKGVIHWVSARHAAKVTVHLYDNLFTKENPYAEEDGDFTTNINPESLIVLTDVPVEPAIADAPAGSRFQIMRKGYFYLDPVAANEGKIIYTRIVGLRDSWAKLNK
ncbi:MAG: hypothetical protein KUA29_04385 [Methanobacterium sp.]|nr:hypothetical protein [Methanobacterium sp.]MBV1767520.1 hypothetical protein [Methanobacterium sp.]